MVRIIPSYLSYDVRVCVRVWPVWSTHWRAAMSLRRWVKRLEHDARGRLASFVLEDGTRHYYDPVGAELFLHMCDCLRAQGTGEPFPEPPETVKEIGRASCRERV